MSLLLLIGLFVAAPPQNPTLTLNKHHEPNQNITSWQIGVPITYVIQLSNSGAANTHVSIVDTLPSGFVFVSATCTNSQGASCPTGAQQPPASGQLTIGEFTIPTGGIIQVSIVGYYKTAGSKTNTAVASARDAQGNPLPVGNAASSIDQLIVTSDPVPVDIEVKKSVNLPSTPWPAHLHYTITVTNLTSTGIFLGGILKLQDDLFASSVSGLNWVVSNLTCTSTGGAVCPDLPPSVANNTSQILFAYDAAGGSIVNDTGSLPGNASYTIGFDVDITGGTPCKTGAATFFNRVLFSWTGVSGDLSGGNNSSQVSTALTGLPDCVIVQPVGATVKKIQFNPATNPVNWNSPITYRITVSNTNSTPLTNVLLSDIIKKVIGTPTFTATVTQGPSCVSGCTTLNASPISPPTVNLDSVFHSLWSATLPSLGPSQTAVIEYKVVYVPVCETDSRLDSIINRCSSSISSSEVQTDLVEWTTCTISVQKVKKTAGSIVFGQPFQYEVVYKNLSANALDIGAVRDVMSVSSNQYGNVELTYSVTYAVSGGAITPAPLAITNAPRTVLFRAFGWQGVRLIDEHLKFDPGATLTCQVTVTAQQPKDDNPKCQGAGNPQLVNSAYLDLSGNYNENDSHAPSFYSSQVADLPLCRKVIVTKTATPQSVGPGAPLVYTIKVENKGNDPVASFTLKDVIQPPLIPTSVTPCVPLTACTTGPTLSGNQVDVSFGLLQSNTPVTFNLTVQAPQAGGSYPNLAQGSFLPGGNFYFQGDEAHFLQQEENIQVLTPTLAKSFEPLKIGPNGIATLVFTITNTNSDPAQSGISFSDTLPVGLQVAGVSTNGCGGTVTVSTDGRTITLTGGQLGAGKHSCQIVVKVKATGACGIYRNNKGNFSNVTNLDVSGINQQLEVADCPPGLIVTKRVEGAPQGFTGKFNFLVQCTTPTGFYQKTVTVDWPTPGFAALNDIPPGSKCTVTEGALPFPTPAGYNWSGLPAYSPSGVIVISDKGGQVVVTNQLNPCIEMGQVKVTKVLKGLPSGFTGTFQGTLKCWISGALVTFPVTLTSPNGLTSVVGNIPLGSTCTFQETGQPPLTGALQWNPPVYSPGFGTVTLGGLCCQEIEVINEAHPCCVQPGNSDNTTLTTRKTNVRPSPRKAGTLPRRAGTLPRK